MMSRTALTLLVLAAATPAFAQTEPQPTSAKDTPVTVTPTAPPPVIELRDPRDDEAKAAAPREQVFISPSGEPFRAAPRQPYPMGAWFSRTDANRDGALTPDEFTADQLAFFVRLDADRNDVIDGFEAGEYEKTIAPEVTFDPAAGAKPRRGLFGRKPAPGATRELQGAAYYGVINEPLPIRAADTDFDYKVTRPEALAASARRFALLDTDRNGRITLAELPQTRAQLRAKR